MTQTNRISDETGKAVLVVEDDAALRASICSMLRGEGITAFEAADGPEALDLLTRNRGTVLIILDLMMARMNGWEFRSRLTADPLLSRIPILAINDNGGQGVYAGPHGVTYSLAKPFKAEDLLAYVRRYVHRGSQRR